MAESVADKAGRRDDMGLTEQNIRFSRREDMSNIDMRICPVCENEVLRSEMDYTRDCHGIPFRLVCFTCYSSLMEKGYDGEYYDEADEQIEDDY